MQIFEISPASGGLRPRTPYEAGHNLEPPRRNFFLRTPLHSSNLENFFEDVPFHTWILFPTPEFKIFLTLRIEYEINKIKFRKLFRIKFILFIPKKIFSSITDVMMTPVASGGGAPNVRNRKSFCTNLVLSSSGIDFRKRGRNPRNI